MRIRACFVVVVLAVILSIPFLTYSKTVEKPVTGRGGGQFVPVTRGADAVYAPKPIESPERRSLRPGPRRSSAAVDTTVLAFFDFEGAGCDTQGWTSLDFSSQPPYFHVDDFSGLAGGTYNRLNAIEGSRSLWCGMRPTTAPELCSYATAPGYGNDWDQSFCTASCVDVTGTVSVDFVAVWDSEAGYDDTVLEYDECDGNWKDFEPAFLFDGVDTSFVSASLPDSLHNGQVRVRFRFTSDVGWSDQDGTWNTDGAIIVDSLTVRDGSGIVVATELFEDEAIGATAANDWAACNALPYGDYAALYPGATLVQEDPCNMNLTCMWAFVSGSAYDYSCGGFPSQSVVPYEDAQGNGIHNVVASPLIPYTGSGNVVQMAYDMYGDLQLNALIFHRWYIRSKVGDCVEPWQTDGYWYYTESGIPAWYNKVRSFGAAIPAGASHVQVGLAVMDMCRYWVGYQGADCTCHSHSPMFDNVSVYRIATFGPQLSGEQFGDAFSEDGTLTGTVRADDTQDTGNNPTAIEYYDDIWVGAVDPQGIAPDSYTGFGSAVYAHVSVRPGNQPGKSAQDLVHDSFRWPVVDSMLVDGNNWYQIRLDTAFFDFENRLEAQPDYWSLDLNDNLFTPGDTIFYFFSAMSAQAPYTVTYWTNLTGNTADLAHVMTNAKEFTCLPAGGYLNGGDILVCVENLRFEELWGMVGDALTRLGIEDKVDRFDLRGSATPGGKVKDLHQQLIPVYRKILWFVSGDISDSDSKMDDYGLVNDFLNFLEGNGGVYFASDHFAEYLAANTTSSAVTFRTSYLNFNLVTENHNTVGLPISPLVTGAAGSPFDGVLGPDTLIAYGGCPQVNSFDVVSASGLSELLAYYDGNPSLGAVVGQKTANTGGHQVGAMMSGFGFQFIRDDRPSGISDRVNHLGGILQWLGTVLDQPVGAEPEPFWNSLAQNHPNPFNPVTSISFTVREQGPVSLKVYNVAGQLVRTLMNDERAPGLVHKIDWNGRNNAGQQVSSGVYFYKLVAKGFTKTKKMVLLK